MLIRELQHLVMSTKDIGYHLYMTFRPTRAFLVTSLIFNRQTSPFKMLGKLISWYESPIIRPAAFKLRSHFLTTASKAENFLGVVGASHIHLWSGAVVKLALLTGWRHAVCCSSPVVQWLMQIKTSSKERVKAFHSFRMTKPIIRLTDPFVCMDSDVTCFC
jgi:hypothetical protein